MIYLPIFGALLEASGTILDKKILKIRGINFKNYVVYGFLAIALVMLPFIYFFWSLKKEALYPGNIIIFLIILVTAVFANILSCYSVKREDLCEIEPIRLMQPLFTILIAFFLSFFFTSYSSEKNVSILILAIIASVSLIASHIRRHHLVYNKYILAALISSLLFAIELSLSKAIIDYYSSFTFYFLRCLLIFIITFLIFRPKIKSIPKKSYLMIIIVSAIWSIYRVILYWGYSVYGVVFTTMMFILSPILIYIFARIFLKEKISLRNMISGAIILVCVVIAIVIENKILFSTILNLLHNLGY